MGRAKCHRNLEEELRNRKKRISSSMAMVLNGDNLALRARLAVRVWEHVGLLHSGVGHMHLASIG